MARLLKFAGAVYTTVATPFTVLAVVWLNVPGLAVKVTTVPFAATLPLLLMT